MKRRMMSRVVAVLFSLALVFSMASFASAAEGDDASETAGTITVKIGDEEAVTCVDFADAMAKVRAADNSAKKVITLSAGTYTPVNGETFRINEPNTVIQGAGVDATIINTGDVSVSGQAGVLLQANGTEIHDLSVVSSNPGSSGGAIKASDIGDGANNMPRLKGIVIENVSVSAGAGFGLNLHGVDGAVVTNVTVEKAAKASVSVALADVAFTNLTTNESGWKADIAIAYNPNNQLAYYAPSSIKVDDSTLEYNVITSERSADANGGVDKVETDIPMAAIKNDDGSFTFVDRDVAAEQGILIERTGEYYATIQAAVNAAEDGDVIDIPAGTYNENLKVEKDITLKGAGEATVIKFVAEDREAQDYFSGKAYPVVYATGNLTMEDLTVAGPTDQHHGIDGILAKADLTMRNVTVKDIRCTADGGDVCGVNYGKGVIVDGDGDVVIENCNIENFQKNGIDIETSGEALIKDNVIKGIDDNSIIAQNGIVLRGGTDATVEGNEISNLRYTADNEWSDGSYAVLAYDDVTLSMTKNIIKDVDNGIVLDGNAEAVINNNVIDTDHYGLVTYSTKTVDAADNYWSGDVADKVYAGEESKVTGLDDVKSEPIIDDTNGDVQEGNGSSATSSDKSAKTGDPFSIAAILGLLGASGAGAGIALRKRNK